jgi:hypothetical protein
MIEDPGFPRVCRSVLFTSEQMRNGAKPNNHACNAIVRLGVVSGVALRGGPRMNTEGCVPTFAKNQTNNTGQIPPVGPSVRDT